MSFGFGCVVIDGEPCGSEKWLCRYTEKYRETFAGRGGSVTTKAARHGLEE